MSYFTNPSTVRIMFLVGGLLFVVCFVALIYVLLRFRRGIAGEAESQARHPLLSPDGLAFAAFQQTIAELKQRQQELESKARAETERAKSAESLTRSLLDNLSTPAIAFNRVGLVKQANPAARNLFGYASPVGLSLDNLFGTSSFVPPQTDEATAVSVPEIVEDALRGSTPLRNLRIACRGRTAVQTLFDMTILPEIGGGLVLLSPAPADRPCTDEVPPLAENSPGTTLNER